MKRNFSFIIPVIALILMLSGCGSSEPSSDTSLPPETSTVQETSASEETDASSATQETSTEAPTQETTTEAPASDESSTAPAETSEAATAAQPSTATESDTSSGSAAASDIDSDTALAIAIDYAGVSEDEISRTQTRRDRSNGIQVYEVEFSTEYRDYDFDIAISDGTIVEMSYEIDEYWLGRLDGSPFTMDEAVTLIQENVPGSSAEDIRIWEERDDGWTLYEGNLYYDGVSYEFEIDPETGIIFNWSEERRI